MREHINKAKSMVMEFIVGTMVRVMMVNGKKIKSKAMEPIPG